MTVVWILLALLFVFALLWALSLYAIRKVPGFYGLGDGRFAHRGLHAKDHGLPENSLRAFRLAADAGYGAELDVRLSRDGRLVVMHDDSLLRTCGIDKNVCDLSAEELDRYHLIGSEEKIPYLEEVLPIFEGRQPLLIEIKAVGNNGARLTNKVCTLLQQFPELQFCIEAFDPRVLIWLRRHKPEIIRGQLSCDLRDDPVDLPKYMKFFLKNLSLNFLSRPHFVAYRTKDRDSASFRLCRLLWGVQEFSWTVTTQEEADAAFRDGRIIIFESFLPQ